MKVRIAFTEKERTKAMQLARACLAFFPKNTMTKHSDLHKPFLHIYIADNNDGHEKPDRHSKSKGK